MKGQTNGDQSVASRSLRAVPVVLAAVFLIFSMLLANHWRLAPEFYYLVQTYSVPLSIQIVAVSVFLILALLFVIRRFSPALLAGILAMFVLSLTSFYHVSVSLSDYTISASIPLVFGETIKLTNGLTISDEPGRFDLRSPDQSASIFTGYFPVGVDHKALKESIIQLGNCTHEVDGECMEVTVSAP